MALADFESSGHLQHSNGEASLPASVEDVIKLAYDHWNDARSIGESLRKEDGILVAAEEIKTVAVYYWQLGCGGADEVARSQLDTLSKLGYTTVIITDNPVPQNTLEELGFPTHRTLPTYEGMSKESYGARARAFEECLVENRVDALIYNQWLSNTALWELLIAKMHGIPTVVCMHGVFAFPLTDLGNGWADKRLTELPQTLSIADAIVCASATDKAFWDELNPNVFITRYKSPSVPAEDEIDRLLAVKEDSIGPEVRSDENLSEPHIIWVGRLSVEKRALDAIDIFARVKEEIPKAVLDMVGPYDQAWHDAITRHCEQLGISESVVMHGLQQDVSRFYRNATLFLHTSSTESYCLSLYEAKSWALPCVMYELPFLELAKNGERGGVVSVRHRDVKAAADACIRILADPKVRVELGVASRQDMKPFLEFDEAGFWEGVISSLRVKRDLPQRENKRRLVETAFRITYENAVSDVGERISSLEERLRSAEASLNEIESSTTFKVGKAIMKIPTRLKDAFNSRR